MNIGAFLSYAVVVTFTPGPNNILSMVNAGREGHKKTLPFMFGIFSGFFVLMLLSCYFNLVLFNYIPRIKIFMSVAGALYLLLLAGKVSGIHLRTRSDNNDVHNKDSGVNTFRTGLLMQFVNPKVILYGLTIISNFIIPHYYLHYQLVLFSLLLASFSFTSINCWALFGAFFNRFIDRYEKPFNYSMSGLLVYSALTVAGIL